ncbi:MAG: glycosyltransferase [Candidatus Dependentiae bacterium]
MKVMIVKFSYRPYLIIVLFMYVRSSAQDNFVDFQAGMCPNQAMNQDFFSRNRDWQLAKKVYESYRKNWIYSKKEKIPKLLHHIWLGSPLPKFCSSLRKTWFEHNPTWKFILWTDNPDNFKYGCLVCSYESLHRVLYENQEQFIVFDVRSLNLINQEAYDITDNYGERSDIIRYEVLFEFGGLYVDTDFECLKSFNIFHHTCDFYAGLGYSKTQALLNGLMGCSSKNLILKICIQDLVKKPQGVQSSIIGRTGPGLLTRSFRKAFYSEGYSGIAVGFPVTTFYPWPNWDRWHKTNEEIKAWIQPESYGIHYWHVSWKN